MMRRVNLPRPLSEGEVKLLDFVVTSVKHLDVTLRIAGGWVRDQMLGCPSDDIDITIETPQGRPYITGEQIASVLAGATQAAHHPHVSVIKTNPEKSKHIETAQVVIMGQQLEFCHLRKDDYTSCGADTRVPTVTVATALEDAQRRDFCCNALFYNLHTREVEDFVGGLDDLQKRVLRCPLDPFETFSDDPLRMLRGVRFSGKLGFAIDPSISQTIIRGNEVAEPGFFTHEWRNEVHKPLVWELLRKVSRERYGIEVAKMLAGPRPLMCVENLARLGLLYSAVLLEMVPTKTKKGASAEYDRIAMVVPRSLWDEIFFNNTAPLMRVAFHGDNNNNNNNNNNSDVHPDHQITGGQDRQVVSLFCMLAAPLVMMRDRVTADAFGQHVDPCDSPIIKGASSSSSAPGGSNSNGGRTSAGAAKASVATLRDEVLKRSEAIVQNGLKLPRKVAEEVGALLLALESMGRGIPEIQKALRECGDPDVAPMSFEGNLRAAVFTALRHIRNSSLPVTVAFLHVVAAIAVDGAEAPARHFVRSLAHDAPLFRCGGLVPVIKGDEIVAGVLPALHRSKVSEVLTVELQYLVDHPAATVDDVRQYLIQQFGHIGLPQTNNNNNNNNGNNNDNNGNNGNDE